MFYKSNTEGGGKGGGGTPDFKFHPKLFQTFFIDVFLVLCKLHFSFSAMSSESSVFSFRSASGGTNKRKDFRFKSTHDAPPNSKVSLILALPQSRQRRTTEGFDSLSHLLPISILPRFLFSHTARSQTDTGNCSAINFSHHEIHPHYGAPAGKRLTALSLHLLVLCLFALIDSSVKGFNLDVSIRAN